MVITLTFLGGLLTLIASYRWLFRVEGDLAGSIADLFLPRLAYGSDEERIQDLVTTERFAIWIALGGFGAVAAHGLLALLGLA